MCDSLKDHSISAAGGASSPAGPASPAPKVSVVVPVYNVERYLRQALESLAEQTLREMEFLCVNDGSTDSSPAILKEFAEKDGRFRVLDGPNGGYGKAMNRGIDAARGEYLGILEPDDFVPPEMYGVLYEKAKAKRLDILKADFWRFTEYHRTLNRLSSDSADYNRILCPVRQQRAFFFVMNTWSGIYRLDFLRQWNIRHNETPGASYQDNGFWFQTFCRARRVMILDRPFYMNRRDNPDSSMADRGKMYAITEEFRFIEAWLSQDPDLQRKVRGVFYTKKFSNFIVTYRRLAPELRTEYARHIRDEFAPALAQGLMDRELMGSTMWGRLQEITADPDAYAARIGVSVIIPVYNAAPYLKRTLDTLLLRSELQIEVICVDDGSTDDSPAILRSYEEKYDRLRVITQANAGAGAARNRGMQYARGEYLSFLDADDLYEPDMLRKAYDKAHAQQADLVVFRCDNYYEDTGEYVPAAYTIHEQLLPDRQPFAGADIERDIFKAFVGWAWDKLFRTEFIRGITVGSELRPDPAGASPGDSAQDPAADPASGGRCLQFQEQRTSNDLLFVFSAVLRAQRIVTMDDVLAHHRRQSGTLSATREKSWDCFYRALCALREHLCGWGLYERREQDFINYSLHSVLWNLHSLTGPAYGQLYAALTGRSYEPAAGESAGNSAEASAAGRAAEDQADKASAGGRTGPEAESETGAGWLADLGITAHGREYYYARREYEDLQRLLRSADAADYLRQHQETEAARQQSAGADAAPAGSAAARRKALKGRLRRVYKRLPRGARKVLYKTYHLLR